MKRKRRSAPPASLDKHYLERLAGVTFRQSSLIEFVELFEIYENRFSEPVEPPIPIWMLADAPPFQKPKRAELGARRSIVEAIDGIWRECGGQGRGSYYHVVKERFDGPLLALLETLFVAVSGSDAPSSATLHHDLAFIATGRERRR